MLRFREMYDAKNPEIIERVKFDLRGSYGSEEQKVVKQAYRWFSENSHRFDREGTEVFVEMGYEFITLEGPRDEHDPFSVPGRRSKNIAYVITFWKEKGED